MPSLVVSKSLVAQRIKNLLQCRRPRFDPWIEKIPGERKGYPLQYSGLENSMDCKVYGVVKSLKSVDCFGYTATLAILRLSVHECFLFI